jgi:Flp pilus assembly pilin Flp
MTPQFEIDLMPLGQINRAISGLWVRGRAKYMPNTFDSLQLASKLRNISPMSGICDRRGGRGQTLVEYALLIALVSVAVIGALVAFSTSVDQNLTNSNTELQKAFSGN